MEFILETLKTSKAFKSGEMVLQTFLHEPLISKSDSAYEDTCMEAEIPLSMAAWNCDLAMVNMLLKYNAYIEAKNSKGDNVFHTLVKVRQNITLCM